MRSKDGSKEDCSPAQPTLPGMRLWDIVKYDYSEACTCARGIETSGFIFCEDAPWECPKSVPPASNTGVHEHRITAVSDCQSAK